MGSRMDVRRLQRWLDGELTEAEGRAFLEDLGEDDRRLALALAAVGRAAARLPRPAPGPDFAARAMARVRTRRPPRRTVWTWLRAPALSPLAACAGALIVAVTAAGVATAWAAWRVHATAARPAPAAVAAAPGAPAGTVLARITLRAPRAREVAVAADFNGWKPEAAPMRRGAGGVWTVEVPLQPGRRYQYMFVVDGQWMSDPEAPATVDDGFGGRNALLEL